MRGYYVYFGSYSEGVINKINMQIKQLNKHSDVKKIQIMKKTRSFIQKGISILPNISIGYDYTSALDEIINPDFIYCRRMTADYQYVNFFRFIKRKYPSCKILIEIPSYPYFRDSYFHSIKHLIRSFPYYLKDMIYTRKLHRYVDRVVTFTKDDKIYGIETIQTRNGTDVDSINMNRGSLKTINEYNLIAVAHFAPHHGYERIIKGIKDYYLNGGKKNVYLHLVGDGKELNLYEKMVEKLELKDRVFFHGKKTGQDLDDIYVTADIGIDCMAMYKDKRNFLSSIKVTEYLAKGLPVITGVDVDVFQKTSTNYNIQFENNELPINMIKVINHLDQLHNGKDGEVVASEIREFAKRTVDNSIVMKRIIKYIFN